jgi:type II secretory pathway pseudopilin PulG
MTSKLMSAKKNDGFSLVEMAIVLVIVMSILTLGLGALSSVVTSSSISETKARQTHIKDALIAYLGANKRLPCPDIPNNTNGTADGSGVSGKEDVTGGVCVSTFGVVPFTTLGLSRDVAEDRWGNLISYQVYVDTSNPCPPTASPPTWTGINWSSSACFGAGKSGGIQIMDGATTIATGVAAVLISHGPNGLRAWSRQGTQNANPLTCEEAQNSNLTTLAGCTYTSNLFFKGEQSANDDVVAYLTADAIIQALAKQGTILSPAAQVADDLRMNMQDVIGQVLQNLNSNIPSYTPTTPPSLIPNDPWGRPYMIVQNPISITKTGTVSSPLRTSLSAICIYSSGADGFGGTTGTTTPGACTPTGDAIAVSLSANALTTLFTNKACSPSC